MSVISVNEELSLSFLGDDFNSSTVPTFRFQEKEIPVTVSESVSEAKARFALQCRQFKTWVKRCEQQSSQKKLELHSVEIQSVDLFGDRDVGFLKIAVDCTVLNEGVEERMKRICFLRGDSVSVLVALHCDDGHVYSLLIEQARIPTGQISALELPARMMDEGHDSVVRRAVRALEEECGCYIDTASVVNLSALAEKDAGLLTGISPSAGSCDEIVHFCYAEILVTVEQLDSLRNKKTGYREFQEQLTVRVVPWDQVWKVSGDAKTMVSMFLLSQLRNEGKVAPPGEIAKQLTVKALNRESFSCDKSGQRYNIECITDGEPVITMSNGLKIPQLAYSLNLVAPRKHGQEMIEAAITAGYRHFDTSQFSRNEKILGNALRNSGVPREEFFITTKIWNEAQKIGKRAVRATVETTLQEINFGDYLDLYMLHWPVPRYFVQTYMALEELQKEGKIRSLGIRNFNQSDYQELVDGGMSIPPAVSQIDVSCVMYPEDAVKFFQEKSIVIGATHVLNQGQSFERPAILEIAKSHGVTPAQVMTRWAMQKNFVVINRSQTPEHMCENRNVLMVSLTDEEMQRLENLTDRAEMKKIAVRSLMRKTSM